MKLKTLTRFVKIAPRKVRTVAIELKGLPIEEAIALIHTIPRRAAAPLFRTLKAAYALAKDREMNIEKTIISVVRVDEGPALKRRILFSRGRATTIQKKMSHVTVVLDDEIPQADARKRQTKGTSDGT